MNRSVLVISDLHIPYQHPQAIDFLAKIKTKYNPDLVICIGDEIDGHSLSFHQHSPDLASPIHELRRSKTIIKDLVKLFPNMLLVESNHGSLIYRRAVYAGLPSGVIKTYNEILNVPSSWVWRHDITIKLSNKRKVYFTHGKGSQPLNLSKSVSMNAVCGHHHEKFAINYWASPSGTYWQMFVGCLIDNKSLAFSYNKISLHNPVLGCGIILNGKPRLLPLILNKSGQWIGEIP